jgi:hypothetical protein
MREELDREFAAALATGKRKKKKVDEYVGFDIELHFPECVLI